MTDERTVDLEALRKLRDPFADSEIDKLPKNISDGPKAHCDTCGGYHKPAGLHLDYVGHAAVTDRFLDVDLCWSWEPLAYAANGLPLADLDERGRPVGLWVRLTVGGMTRLGYGTVDAGKAEPMKELIGDALRNAGMRFGVALGLWKKHGDADAAESKTRGTKAKTAGTPTSGSQTPAALIARLFAVMNSRGCGEPFIKELAKHKWADSDGSFRKLGSARIEELTSFIEKADEEKLDRLAIKLMGDDGDRKAKKPTTPAEPQPETAA